MSRWKDAPTRFFSHVVIKHNGCWQWTGAKNPKGYGTFRADGRNVAAHRYSYELFCGPFPRGLVSGHLCRNHGCVNPSHIEPVTNRENILRGVGVTAIKARQTHCAHGHLLSGGNLIRRRNGQRGCRECFRVSYPSSRPRYEGQRAGKGLAG